MRRTLLISLGMLFCLTAPRCALFRYVPSNMTLRLLPRPDLNPNDLGEPTPLDVRIYQLSDKRLFTQASFEELWTDDKKLLADELQLDLPLPGQSRRYPAAPVIVRSSIRSYGPHRPAWCTGLAGIVVEPPGSIDKHYGQQNYRIDFRRERMRLPRLEV